MRSSVPKPGRGGAGNCSRRASAFRAVLLARIAWVAAALAMLLFSAEARADVTGLGLSSYEPAERGSTWFSAESIERRADPHPATGVIADYAYRPLVLDTPSGAVALVRDQARFHLGGAVSLGSRVRAGLSLPVTLLDRGSDATAGGTRYAAPTGSDIGDLRFAAQFRALDVTTGDGDKPLSLAFGARVWLPTGRRDTFTGDERLRFEPRLLASGRAGFFAYAAHAGVVLVPYPLTFDGVRLSNALSAGAAAGLSLWNGALTVGPELYARTPLADPFAAQSTPAELLFGGHVQLGDFRAGAALGGGLGRAFGAAAARGIVSVEWVPPAPLPAEPP